jgi:PTS system ascorbate-specific IIA component
MGLCAFSASKNAIIEHSTFGNSFMTIGILLIAHAPLASALRECVMHVFPDTDHGVLALDVQPTVEPEKTLDEARDLMKQLGTKQVLVLTDIYGATPCNVAQKLVDGLDSKLVAGVNLPMAIKAVTYRNESLDGLVMRALAGATQCIMQVAVSTPLHLAKENQ